MILEREYRLALCDRRVCKWMLFVLIPNGGIVWMDIHVHVVQIEWNDCWQIISYILSFDMLLTLPRPNSDISVLP